MEVWMAGMPRARDTEGSEKDPPKQSLLLLFPGDELLIIFQCSRRISDITEQYLTFVSSVLVNYWSSLLLNTCSTLLLLSAPPLQFSSLLPPPSLPTPSPYPTSLSSLSPPPWCTCIHPWGTWLINPHRILASIRYWHVCSTRAHFLQNWGRRFVVLVCCSSHTVRLSH